MFAVPFYAFFLLISIPLCGLLGIIPDHWCKYKIPKTISLNHWIADLKSRLQQLESITRETDFQYLDVWLGGLFMPEAFITATRQAVAQKHQWSLEELRLEVDINKHGDADAFAVTGKCTNFRNTRCLNYY